MLQAAFGSDADGNERLAIVNKCERWRSVLSCQGCRCFHRRLAGVFATEAQAHRQARGLPMLGGFVAELRIPTLTPEGQPQNLVYERTLRTPGHHTLWASPALLLACVGCPP